MSQFACTTTVLLLGLTACADNTPNDAKAAMAFSAGAEACLLAVRDRGQKYEAAPECQRLKQLSQAYINAGGQLGSESIISKLAAEQGRATAWNARAVSLASDPTISLW